MCQWFLKALFPREWHVNRIFDSVVSQLRENFEQADPISFSQITLYTSLHLLITYSTDWFGESGLLVWAPSLGYMSFPLLNILASGFGESIFVTVRKWHGLFQTLNTCYDSCSLTHQEMPSPRIWKRILGTKHDLLSNWFGATELMQQLKPDTSFRAINSSKRDESVPKAEQLNSCKRKFLPKRMI